MHQFSIALSGDMLEIKCKICTTTDAKFALCAFFAPTSKDVQSKNHDKQAIQITNKKYSQNGTFYAIID